MSCLAECTKDSSLIGLTGYGGADIPVKGTCKMPCSYKDNHVDAEFYVMETNSRTILSLKTCKQQNLVKFLHSLKPIHATTGRPMEEIKEQYENVFQGLGKLEQSYHMKMDPKAVPVAQSPRKIAATLRGKLKEDLDRMEADEVVAKVYKPTEWVHNPVVVEKNNGKLRICLDPRELNKYLKREHFQLPTWE